MTDNITQNYMRDALIEKELENVEIENYLEFDYNGHYTWFECIYCGGPTLGHIQPKCPKTEDDETNELLELDSRRDLDLERSRLDKWRA